MPIENFVDHRTNKHCVKIRVVFQSSCIYNSIPGATQFPKDDTCMGFELNATTIVDAIWFAKNKWPTTPITMCCHDVTTVKDDGSDPFGQFF